MYILLVFMHGGGGVLKKEKALVFRSFQEKLEKFAKTPPKLKPVNTG